MTDESKLQDKLSYGDIFRYFIPGSYLVTLVVATWWITGHEFTKIIELGLLGGLLFIMAAFFGGLFIQTLAAGFPEWIITNSYWSGTLPVKRVLLPNDSILNDRIKTELISMLTSVGHLNYRDLNSNGTNDQMLSDITHKVIVNILSPDELREHSIAEAYYKLYRGLATTNLFASIWTLVLIHFFPTKTITLSLFCLANAILFYSFFKKTKGVAEKAAKEPLIAIYSKNIRKKLADQDII